jgi:AcrR family transcriptional regulator
MAEVKPPNPETRAYRSPRRAAQARATRAAVLDAARARFLEVGYVATTVDAVAAAADVSPATVYGIFGSKRGLLEATHDAAVVGDTDAVPLAARAWIAELDAITDRRARIRALYGNLREVYERTAALDGVLEEAAVGDPALAELAELHRSRQLADTDTFRSLVMGERRVFEGLDAHQDRDALWALGGQQLYRRLTGDCGWTPAQWEDWIVELTERLFDTATT